MEEIMGEVLRLIKQFLTIENIIGLIVTIFSGFLIRIFDTWFVTFRAQKKQEKFFSKKIKKDLKEAESFLACDEIREIREGKYPKVKVNVSYPKLTCVDVLENFHSSKFESDLDLLRDDLKELDSFLQLIANFINVHNQWWDNKIDWSSFKYSPPEVHVAENSKYVAKENQLSIKRQEVMTEISENRNIASDINIKKIKDNPFLSQNFIKMKFKIWMKKANGFLKPNH